MQARVVNSACPTHSVVIIVFKPSSVGIVPVTEVPPSSLHIHIRSHPSLVNTSPNLRLHVHATSTVRQEGYDSPDDSSHKANP
eukprot:67799-Pyramimonas_sp.AAC.2